MLRTCSTNFVEKKLEMAHQLASGRTCGVEILL